MSGRLQVVESTDVMALLASDMFEYWVVELAVLKRGPISAQEQEISDPVNYKRMNPLMKSSSGTPSARGKSIQKTIGGNLQSCIEFFNQRDPEQIERAKTIRPEDGLEFSDGYLLISTGQCRNSRSSPGFQIGVGPAWGAFNDWVKGIIWSTTKNRKWADVAPTNMEALHTSIASKSKKCKALIFQRKQMEKK